MTKVKVLGYRARFEPNERRNKLRKKEVEDASGVVNAEDGGVPLSDKDVEEILFSFDLISKTIDHSAKLVWLVKNSKQSYLGRASSAVERRQLKNFIVENGPKNSLEESCSVLDLVVAGSKLHREIRWRSRWDSNPR